MTLEYYHSQLTKIIRKNPEASKLSIVTSSDDEGNHFTPVIYPPALGRYHERGSFNADSKSPNCVCLN